MMQCNVCGEFFNPACLSEVFEHEHKGISTKKEYYGKEVKKKGEDNVPKNRISNVERRFS